MPNLRALHLANTRIDGKLPRSWGALSTLTLLDLQGTDVIQPVPSSWHALCKKNGTRVWDKDLQEHTWPNNLQHGKVAFVKFPWAGPQGGLSEINHNSSDPNNICHNLAIASRARLLIIATGCVCGLTVLACSGSFILRGASHAKLWSRCHPSFISWSVCRWPVSKALDSVYHSDALSMGCSGIFPVNHWIATATCVTIEYTVCDPCLGYNKRVC